MARSPVKPNPCLLGGIDHFYLTVTDFGRSYISFEDPDGIRLEIVARTTWQQ